MQVCSDGEKSSRSEAEQGAEEEIPESEDEVPPSSGSEEEHAKTKKTRLEVVLTLGDSERQDDAVANRTRARSAAPGRKHKGADADPAPDAQAATKRGKSDKPPIDIDVLKPLILAAPKYLTSCTTAPASTEIALEFKEWEGGLRMCIPEYGVHRGKLFTRKYGNEELSLIAQDRTLPWWTPCVKSG